MYKQRLHVFISICSIAVAICLGRLALLQVVKCSQYRQEIEDARILPPIQLPTVRGSILDRNGNAIATDKPVFYVQTNYMVTRLLDDRFWEAEIQQVMQVNKEFTRDQAEFEMHEEFADQIATVSKLRLINKHGTIAKSDMPGVDQAIKTQLHLN